MKMSNNTQGLLTGFGLLTIFLMGFWGGNIVTKMVLEPKIAIECLRGNNPYCMEIIYKTHVVNQDTLYSVDTLFVKKSEIKNEV